MHSHKDNRDPQAIGELLLHPRQGDERTILERADDLPRSVVKNFGETNEEFYARIGFHPNGK